MKKFVNYCKSCYDELAHKVTWPSGTELVHNAIVVLCASLVIALFVCLVDVIFKEFMTLVYSIR